MRRGTTPTHIFKLGIDLEGVTALYITYQQNGEIIVEKALGDEGVELDVPSKSVIVTLTQAETLLFTSDQWDRFTHNGYGENRVRVQIRVKYNDGAALASDIINISAEAILKDGEI